MNFVFVKDSEGYVFKKLQSEVSPDEKIISKKEYIKKSGITKFMNDIYSKLAIAEENVKTGKVSDVDEAIANIREKYSL